jgi:molecular chaperone GrpE (heat shock protein)
MPESAGPALKKWPFLFANLLLLAATFYIAFTAPEVSIVWRITLIVVLVLSAAFCLIAPFVAEHRAELRLLEANSLTTAVEQISNLRAFTNQISFATAQWQVVQTESARTVATAREIGERIATEAQAFAEAMQKAGDADRATLRLEIDKLRREEADRLQVIVLLMDHVYALYLAGRRSGQENILQQLASFQTACREVTRKMGLIPFEPQPNEPFNPQVHQLLEDGAPSDSARVTGTLAPGYTYQGQLVRNALVSIGSAEGAKPEPKRDFVASAVG